VVWDEHARAVSRGEGVHRRGALHERGVEAARQTIEAERRLHLPDLQGPDHRKIGEPEVEVVEVHAVVRDAELDFVVDGPEEVELALGEQASAPDLGPIVDVGEAPAGGVPRPLPPQLEPDGALHERAALLAKRPEVGPERYELAELVAETVIPGDPPAAEV